MRTRVSIAMLGLGLSLLAVTGASPQDQERVERLTVAYNAYENNITPFTLTMQSLPNTPDLVGLVYDNLFWSQASDEPRSLLATGAEANEDLTSWTVSLRDDVTWHDGEPFTAEDVAFTYRYFTDVHRVGRYAHHVYDVPPFEAAEVLDDTTVRLDFAAPAPTFPLLPGGDVPIVPRHIWEDIDDPGAETELLPVGTGPFQLIENVSDERYRFEANEDYFLGRPYVDELVLPIVQDPSSVFAGLRTGELDAAVHPVPPELLEDFTADEDLAVLEATRMETVILYLNARSGPTGDAAFRKALALSIDRDEIVDTVMLGNALPGFDSFTHPAAVWVTDEPVQEFDRERAAELLDDAGYERQADGTRTTPDGDPATIEILVSSFAPQHQRAMELVAEHAETVGIEVDVEALDPATINDRRTPDGPGESPPVDGFVRAMESHMHADPDAMIHFFGTPEPGRPGAGLSGYANPDFDALAEQAAVETDPAARLEMIHGLQAIFAEDVPAIALYYPDGRYAVRPAAYDRWVADVGHGTFHKLSFVPTGAELATGELELTSAAPDGAETGDPADADTPGQAAAGTDADGSPPWGVIALVGLGAALVVVALIARRRGGEVYD